jgi:hypothetical protein
MGIKNVASSSCIQAQYDPSANALNCHQLLQMSLADQSRQVAQFSHNSIASQNREGNFGPKCFMICSVKLLSLKPASVMTNS